MNVIKISSLILGLLASYMSSATVVSHDMEHGIAGGYVMEIEKGGLDDQRDSSVFVRNEVGFAPNSEFAKSEVVLSDPPSINHENYIG